MNYLIEFFKNLVSTVCSIFPSITDTGASFLPTSTFLSATETISTGFDQENDYLGTTIVGLGSSVSSAAIQTDLDLKKEVQPSQAYIESMSVNELNSFINKLENFEIEDKPKVLKKTINNNYPKI